MIQSSPLIMAMDDYRYTNLTHTTTQKVIHHHNFTQTPDNHIGPEEGQFKSISMGSLLTTVFFFLLIQVPVATHLNVVCVIYCVSVIVYLHSYALFPTSGCAIPYYCFGCVYVSLDETETCVCVSSVIIRN